MDEEHLINKLSQWSRLHKKIIYSALDSLIQGPNTVLRMSHLINALSSHVIIATTGHKSHDHMLDILLANAFVFFHFISAPIKSLKQSMLIKEIVLHNPSSEHFMLASNPGCTHVEPWWNRSARAASRS